MTVDSRLRILAEVSHSLAAVTTDFATVLQTIASTCARLVGDGCLVTLLDEDRGLLVGMANAHRDIDLAKTYREYVGSMEGVPPDGQTMSAAVFRSGQPVFVPQIDPAVLVERSPVELRPLLERLDIRSFIIVPIRAHGATIGTLSLMRTGPDRDYVQDDVVLLADLADRAGLAIDNARLYRELEQRVRARTTELETFAFAVAHSIRAPLRSIAAFSDALYEDANGQLPPQSQDDLARIRMAVGRVRETVDSLLHLAKLTGMDLRIVDVDLSALAAELVERLRAIEPARSIEFHIEPEIFVRADQRLVELALSSLLSNAWHSTRGRADAKVWVSAERSAATTKISVRDNGSLALQQGRALLARDGSSSRTPPRGDFGVGLVIARQAIDRHGGMIDIEAPDEGGTTVWFTLAK